MTNLQSFEQFDIRLVEHPEGRFKFGVAAVDLAKALKLQNARQLSCEDAYKGMDKIQTNGGIQSVSVIWEPGIRQILSKSRSPQAKYLATMLGIDVIICPSIESKTIEIIAKAFKHLNPVQQFFVSGYRIDLYFPLHRISVECDESHHQRRLELDQKRQDVITSILGCTWVRYNPESQGFCVGDIINKIMLQIYCDFAN